ncbi:MAG TPA: replication initiation protein [Azospirillaceae bacterium]|nr:replication initiation protein [Azospirillaceae bacterium]
MATDPTFPKSAAAVHISTEGVELTGLDRRLFNYLLAVAYPDLSEKQIFEVRYAQVSEWLGSHESPDRVRASLKRLSKVHVTLNYLGAMGEEREQFGGILYADTAKDGSGIIRFEFPRLARPWLASPAVFARLRLAVVGQFRGKYTTTLYELMELYANRQFPVWEVSLADFRSLLGIPSDKLDDFRAFRRRALEPAIEEVNELSDLRVEWEPVKEGKSVGRLRFTVEKKPDRLAFEAELKHRAVADPVGHARADRDPRTVDLIDGRTDEERRGPPALRAATYDRFRLLYPGLDADAFVLEWRQAFAGKKSPRDPDKAFLAWMETIRERGQLVIHGLLPKAPGGL